MLTSPQFLFLSGPLHYSSGSSHLAHLNAAGSTLVWAVVLLLVFLECGFIVGLFLPGDSMLLTAGVVLASRESGQLQVLGLAVGAIVAAVAGNQVGYVIGQRAGHRLVARRNGRYLNPRNLGRVAILLNRHGFVAVVVARWVPWVRTLCPLLAGAAGMNYRRYTMASTLGAVVWAPVLLLLGYFAGYWLDRVPWLLSTVIAVLVVILLAVTAIGMHRYRLEVSRPASDFDVQSASVELTVPPR